MGIEFDLFDCDIPQEAKCRICFKVIEDPVKIEYNQRECHVCKNCCIDHFEQENNDLEFGEITWESADEYVRSAIESLTMKCPNITYGCKAVFSIHDLATHVQYCGWRPFKCRWNCGTTLGLQKVKLHEKCCDLKPNSNNTMKCEETLKDNQCDKMIQNCGNDIAYGDDTSNEFYEARIVSNVEVDFHRTIDGDNQLEAIKGEQRFGSLYRKVADLEQTIVKFEQKVDEMNEKHDEDVKKLYDYSYELMQTLMSQTQEDVELLKTQLNDKQQHKRRKAFKRCVIQ